MYWGTAGAAISSDLQLASRRSTQVITAGAAVGGSEANQLEGVCAVKGRPCDKSGHGVACLLCHLAAQGAVSADKCHSVDVRGVWAPGRLVLIIPMAPECLVGIVGVGFPVRDPPVSQWVRGERDVEGGGH